MTYQAGLLKLQKGRNGRKKLENHTYLLKRGENLAVQLHETDVVTITPDNIYTLNSGGWRTPTTKDRINNYSPARVFAQQGLWYLDNHWIYEDGTKVNYAGDIISGASPIKNTEHTKKLVDKMVKGYIAEFLRHIKSGKLEEPSQGDCWSCSMQKSEGNKLDLHDQEPMGVSHLFSHFEEGYCVPSLLYRALEEKGYRDPSYIWDLIVKGGEYHATSSLQAYFRKRKIGLMKELEKKEGRNHA